MKDWHAIANKLIADNTNKEALAVAVATALEIAATKNRRASNNQWLDYLQSRLAEIECKLDKTQKIAQGAAGYITQLQAEGDAAPTQ